VKVLTKYAVWFIVGCLAGCASEQQPAEQILVVVTIPPQAEFAERIGGDTIRVTVMVPPGASPHTYEPTPAQLADVSSCALYATVGSGVEFELTWMDRIVEMNNDMVVVDCSEGIHFIAGDAEHDRYDPHIWLSPKNAVIMVENLYRGLIRIDPENTEYYTRNKDAYIKELDELDTTIVETLSTKKPNKIMVYHPSWAYFCKEYGLEQISIEREGKELTPQGIAAVIEQARNNGITVIFASPQFNTESAHVIAQEIDGVVVLVDPLHKHYIDNMLQVAEAFGEV
jgi:zinc transport system substrate-binding protein